MQLLLDRIKQGITSCKVRASATTPIELRSSRNCSRPQEAATFLKKRAALEDEYTKSLSKLARTSSADYATVDGKAG